MLQRILDLGGEVIARYDTSSLRYIASSGSALGAALATAVHATLRPDPLQHLRLDRGLAGDRRRAGRPPGRAVDGGTAGARQRRADPRRRRRASSAPATVGRVFVGKQSRFEGYTGGGGKEDIGGLLSSGDVGHFDRRGRLFIDGRDDDMIVSGGENVFPAEVEDLLGRPPGRRRGRRGRRRRRGVRPAPQGVRRAPARRQAHRAAGQGARPQPPRPVQGPGHGRVRRRAAAHDDRASCGAST